MSVAGRSLCLAALLHRGGWLLERDESGQPAPATDDVTATTQASPRPRPRLQRRPTPDPTSTPRVRQIASDWFGPAGIGGVVAVIGTPDGQVHVATIGRGSAGRRRQPSTT